MWQHLGRAQYGIDCSRPEIAPCHLVNGDALLRYGPAKPRAKCVVELDVDVPADGQSEGTLHPTIESNKVNDGRAFEFGHPRAHGFYWALSVSHGVLFHSQLLRGGSLIIECCTRASPVLMLAQHSLR